MASSNYREPTCGQNENEKSSGYSDLSHLCGGLLAGESMANGNTVTDSGGTGAPGFPAEQTYNEPGSVVPDPDDAPTDDFRPLVS